MTGRLLAAWRVNRLLPLLTLALLAANLWLLGWIGFALSPRVVALQHRYEARQSLAERSAREREQILSPSRRYHQTEADLQRFHQAVVARSQFTGLLEELFALADEAGLGIERISYDPKQLEENQLLRYGLVFSVAGGYGQIKEFVFSLEQSPRILAIEEIALSGSGDAAAGGMVRLNIRLATYFRQDPP